MDIWKMDMLFIIICINIIYGCCVNRAYEIYLSLSRWHIGTHGLRLGYV